MRGTSSMIAAALLLLLGCTSKHIKPVASAQLMTEKTPKLAEFLRKALKDETIDGKVVNSSSLISAQLFSEGHFHETWRLTVELDGKPKEMVLKVFREQAKADENAINYGFAAQYGWPIPTEIIRGVSAAPLRDKPFLLMEFVEGGTLRRAVTAALAAGGEDTVNKVAALYGRLGGAVGELHRKSLRKRERFDISGRSALEELIKACAAGGWCAAAAQERFNSLLPTLDGPDVAFIHGDLYESQLLMEPDGKVRAFIDLDRAHFEDQARDVGSVLAHLLVINPRTRKAAWDVANPTPAETQASAKAFLAGYKAAADISDDALPDLLARAEAFMWIRLHEVNAALEGSSHGKPVVDALTAGREMIFASNPFKDAGIIE